VRFATKTGLAKGMLQSAISAGIQPAWFVALEVYRTPLRAMVGANGRDNPMCSLLIGGNLLLLTSKLIMPKTLLTAFHPRVGSDALQERERRKAVMSGLVSN